MDLIVTVKEIKGRCPVYNSRDTIFIKDGYILDVKNSADVCMHSLASIMPYYVALSKGVSQKSLGLSGEKEGSAYIQCLDPCKVTGGGTVIFEITPCSA
ncbi:MAG TPA: TIGR04076 family protein [Desulfatiglandales bacterium]|nr:TIGR04076 family protein [Desulfatiglandales bacterium]